MPTMIKYSSEEFDKIKEYFPNLQYLSDCNQIVGKFTIGPCRYVEKKEDQWKIELCDEDQDDVIKGEYLILIDLNLEGGFNTGAKVWEVSEKIEQLATSFKKSVADLHLYPKDKSCCLGIRIENQQYSLSEFVFNGVYPYFVWQAYYAKYKEIPPCGEYSHGKTGLEEAEQDYEKTMTSALKFGRNKNCPCGSEKKYKKCCWIEDERKKSFLQEAKLKWKNKKQKEK